MLRLKTLTDGDLRGEDAPVTKAKPGRGGRGCPSCGTHETKMLGKTEQICRHCGHVWKPCAPYCRGYRLDKRHPEGPTVIGCPDCGVPTRFARHWAEAWRSLAFELDELKFEAIDK